MWNSQSSVGQWHPVAAIHQSDLPTSAKHMGTPFNRACSGFKVLNKLKFARLPDHRSQRQKSTTPARREHERVHRVLFLDQRARHAHYRRSTAYVLPSSTQPTSVCPVCWCPELIALLLLLPSDQTDVEALRSRRSTLSRSLSPSGTQSLSPSGTRSSSPHATTLRQTGPSTPTWTPTCSTPSLTHSTPVRNPFFLHTVSSSQN